MFVPEPGTEGIKQLASVWYAMRLNQTESVVSVWLQFLPTCHITYTQTITQRNSCCLLKQADQCQQQTCSEVLWVQQHMANCMHDIFIFILVVITIILITIPCSAHCTSWVVLLTSAYTAPCQTSAYTAPCQTSAYTAPCQTSAYTVPCQTEE